MSKARLGCLGLGWIGRQRMEAMLATEAVDLVAICDPSPEVRQSAAALVGEANWVATLDDLLALDLDGIAIATPSALHAEQAVRCLEAGAAVFCQKPLGRDARETRAVVDAARRADRLLAVDLSYRRTRAMEAIVELLRDGALGRIFAIDLTFHNAYGPDKSWFYDRARAGGGCVVDLGVHLVDLALWASGFPSVVGVGASLYRGGAPLHADMDAVEDYAAASFTLGSGAHVRLACSWRLHAGQDARIEAAFYGSRGGAVLRNIDGSFYDFTAEHHTGTARRTLVEPPDAWAGRAAAAWATRLAGREGFDAEAEQLVKVAEVLDAIYASASAPPARIDLP